MRLRVEYSVKGLVKFLSHRNIVKVFSRGFRRCKVPFQITKGFSPHIKLSSGPARPVGISSRREFLELKLKDDVEIDLREIQNSLNAYLPRGIIVNKMEFTQDPQLSDSLVERIRYRIFISQAGKTSLEQLYREIHMREKTVGGLIEDLEVFSGDDCLRLVIDVKGIKNIWDILNSLFPKVDREDMIQWGIERECFMRK